MTAKTYAILNYGCQMNESDAEHYAGQLQELGYKAAENFHAADVVVVNTCCVRESAEKRILGKIGELKGVKANYPGQIVCVAGCMAQKDGEKLIKKHPQIDLLIGTAHVNGFKEILAEYLSEKGERVYNSLEVKESEFEGERIRQSGFSAWIPIMYGCNNFCTYCIVPYVRGRERSRSIENIVDEVRQAVAKGYKEFTLLGQNVNSYGKDFGVKDQFAKLLRRVNEIPGVERIRYMTSHPRDMHEDVIKAVAECEHICENFHIPFQSGSNKILKAMNRGYTREKYLELVAMIRRYVPEAAITTDIIVGFPGETEADFNDTLNLVKEVGFDAAFTFIYSKRSGTPAAAMEEQVPLEIKKARLNLLMEAQNISSLQRNEALVGKTLEVLAEGPSNNNKVWSGRTRTNKLVLWPVEGRDFELGDKVQVQIETAQTWLLKGKAVE
ncbi:tRNA (N6-isopentenyl adenosine(37)-C2)-methylthiotransferase MiaB [Phascolarctobacterium faecium]|uniref:tRNA (N6-isopentenyl adenosine(37)-C2)-methylthiotransferase MiaB n=1 Tax=Phascolarctobacterium faecium TaxID=33025 RepID=UPI003A9314BF